MRTVPPTPRPGLLQAAAVLLSFAAAAIAISAQTQSLSLVSTAWSPFTNNAGQPRVALDLVEAALGRFKFAAKTTIVAAGDFTPMLLGGTFDGSGAVWKDTEREKVLIFSQPYLENRLVLVARRGGDVSAKSLTDLKGRRIAIVEGYSYGDSIDSRGPIFVRSTSEEDSLTRLLNSSVEYTLMDELVVQHIVSTYPKESGTRLQIGTIPLITRSLFLAVRRSRPDAESIISRFNAQLRGMIADRTYHRLLNVDWIWADVNGDGTAEYIPRSDRPGPTEPQNTYALFASPTALSTDSSKKGFYLGGSIYTDWASVPEAYKSNTDFPDSRRSTASIFKFTW